MNMKRCEIEMDIPDASGRKWQVDNETGLAILAGSRHRSHFKAYQKCATGNLVAINSYLDGNKLYCELLVCTSDLDCESTVLLDDSQLEGLIYALTAYRNATKNIRKRGAQ